MTLNGPDKAFRASATQAENAALPPAHTTLLAGSRLPPVTGISGERILIRDGHMLAGGSRQIISLEELNGMLRELWGVCDRLHNMRRSGIDFAGLIENARKCGVEPARELAAAELKAFLKVDLARLKERAIFWSKRSEKLKEGELLDRQELWNLRTTARHGAQVSFAANAVVHALFSLTQGPVNLLLARFCAPFSPNFRWGLRHAQSSPFADTPLENLAENLELLATRLHADRRSRAAIAAQVRLEKEAAAILQARGPLAYQAVLAGDALNLTVLGSDAAALIDKKVTGLSTALEIAKLAGQILYAAHRNKIDLVSACSRLAAASAQALLPWQPYLDVGTLARVCCETAEWQSNLAGRFAPPTLLSGNDQRELGRLALEMLCVCQALSCLEPSCAALARARPKTQIAALDDDELGFLRYISTQIGNDFLADCRTAAWLTKDIAEGLGYFLEDRAPNTVDVPRNEFLTVTAILDELRRGSERA